jgi:hypothetical protein
MHVPAQINAAQGDMRRDRANSRWVFRIFDDVNRRTVHMATGADSEWQWAHKSLAGGMDLSCARSPHVELAGGIDEIGAQTVRGQVSTLMRMTRSLPKASYILNGSKASRMMYTPAYLAKAGCHKQRDLMWVQALL